MKGLRLFSMPLIGKGPRGEKSVENDCPQMNANEREFVQMS